jgi:hypothetical protein
MPISKTTSTPKYTSVTADDLEIDDGTLSIDATNNRVGIGTTSPAALAHLYSAAASQNPNTLEMLRLEVADEGVDMNAGHGPGVDFYVGETSGSNYGGTVAVVKEAEGDADSSAAMTFHTASDDEGPGTAREKMRITSAGNVGIGTTSPSATLEVTNASDAGAPLTQLNSNDTDQIMMDINAANIDANVIDITADGVTTSDVLFISMDGATGGSAIAVEDGSSSVSARDVVEIKQTSASSVNATTLSVESTGGKIGQYLGKDYSHASAATVKGLWIDFDKTGTTTTNNTLVGIDLDMDNTTATNGTNTMVGISVTPTLTHAADAGTTVVKGIAITATGGTNGAATTTGLDLTATGADTNMGIVTTVADGGTDIRVNSSADTGDYCSISTTTHGATTIATVDDDAAAAHLTLDVDGNITLDADGGTVTFSDGGSSLGTITSSGITTAGLLGAAGVAAGGGVSGAGSLSTYVAKINGEFVTTILVDIAGLIDSGYNAKVIGDSDEAAAYLTQLTSAANGLIYKIEMSCIEAPTTGNADINLYANPSSLAEGASVTSGGALLLDSNASWSLGRRIVSPASGSALTNAVTSAASQYIYLAQGTMGGSSDATYGAGKFIIKFYGTAI